MAPTGEAVVDLTPEQWRRALGLSAARELFLPGRQGKRPSVDTLRDWASPAKGYRPAWWAGPPLVLMTVRVGQDYLVLPEWVEAFDRERLRMGSRPAPPKAENARSRAAARRRADKRLDSLGVG